MDKCSVNKTKTLPVRAVILDILELCCVYNSVFESRVVGSEFIDRQRVSQIFADSDSDSGSDSILTVLSARGLSRSQTCSSVHLQHYRV